MQAFLCSHLEAATQLKSWPININCPEEGGGLQSSEEMIQTARPPSPCQFGLK